MVPLSVTGRFSKHRGGHLMTRNPSTQKIATAAFAVAMIAMASATQPAASPRAPGTNQGVRGGEGGGLLPPKSGSDPKALAVAAYIYGYPLVTMEMTRRVMTNVEKPEGMRAPMGQLARMREYPTAAFRDVTAPNAD